MDGDQLVDFYWIDPMLTAERIAAKSQYAGHMYYQFELEESWDRAGVRAFGRINGGLIFEAAYILDPTSVPLLSVFYADKSHNKGMSHHPVYRKCLCCIYSIFCFILHILHILYIFVTISFFSESLFNIKEDMRAKPRAWYNVGWMPIIDEGKSCPPGQDLIVMLQEMCAFTKNAGDTFFAPSSIIQTPKLFFSAIIRQDRYAMGLERH